MSDGKSPSDKLPPQSGSKTGDKNSADDVSFARRNTLRLVAPDEVIRRLIDLHLRVLKRLKS